MSYFGLIDVRIRTTCIPQKLWFLVQDWAEWVLNEAEKESQLALGHPLSILDSHPTSRCQTVHKFLSGVINISEFLSRNLYKGHCLPNEMQKNDNNIDFFAQFYIQLLYRPYFGTWILPFGLLGSKWEISETTEFLLKYATFWGGFFMFSWAKN